MYIKTITYTDYNGNKRTEKFFFNLSKAEIIEMELSTEGGFAERIQSIIDAQDTPTLIAVFKDLILKSYGEKTADGRRFEKSPELSKAFSETEAFSEMYVELATNAKAATDFINGIVPKDISEEAANNTSNIKVLGNINTKPADTNA